MSAKRTVTCLRSPTSAARARGCARRVPGRCTRAGRPRRSTARWTRRRGAAAGAGPRAPEGPATRARHGRCARGPRRAPDRTPRRTSRCPVDVSTARAPHRRRDNAPPSAGNRSGAPGRVAARAIRNRGVVTGRTRAPTSSSARSSCAARHRARAARCAAAHRGRGGARAGLPGGSVMASRRSRPGDVPGGLRRVESQARVAAGPARAVAASACWSLLRGRRGAREMAVPMTSTVRDHGRRDGGCGAGRAPRGPARRHRRLSGAGLRLFRVLAERIRAADDRASPCAPPRRAKA